MQANINFKEISQKKELIGFIGYLVLFYFIWSLKELSLLNLIQTNDTISAILSGLIKILVWIVPVWLFIKYFLNTNPSEYLKLNQNVGKGIFWSVFLSFLLGIYFTINVYIVNKQTFDFSLSLHHYLNVFLLVGITEEFVFRGFVLQEINKRISFLGGNIISALLFYLSTIQFRYTMEYFFILERTYTFFLLGLYSVLYLKRQALYGQLLYYIRFITSFYYLFKIKPA